MDRVLVNHLSTWQVVYDAIGADNSESFNLYNQGKLDEWTWIKLDLGLIEAAFKAMGRSRSGGAVLGLVRGWPNGSVQRILDHGVGRL